MCVLLSDMLLHVGILSKFQSTPSAHVWLHTSVQQFVAHKVMLEFELFVANITLGRVFLIIVNLLISSHYRL